MEYESRLQQYFYRIDFHESEARLMKNLIKFVFMKYERKPVVLNLFYLTAD